LGAVANALLSACLAVRAWLRGYFPAFSIVVVASEAFNVSKRKRDPVTKRIQKIIFSLAVLIAHPKAFDLVDQMVL
jgi:hypothetical protein